MSGPDDRDALLDPRKRQTKKTIKEIAVATLLCAILMVIIAAFVTGRREKAARDALAEASIDPQIQVLANGNVIFARDGTIDRALADWLETNDGKPRSFEVGEAQFVGREIEPGMETRSHLPNLIAMLQAYPDCSVRILGYTNATGDAAADVALTNARAKWLYRHLVKAGIKADRLSYEGMGGRDPLSHENSVGVRRLNERVVLRFDPAG